MSFQDFSLHPQVLAGVKSVGYTKPTPIQQQAIPVALEGRDVLGLAMTGTGKTAAFALPILHRLATTPPKRGVRCLVIAPTRELAEQIHQAFIELGQHLHIKSVAVYGGVAKGPQLAALRRGAQVVVACPGRLLDHVSQKDIDLTGVEVLVLDEADTMCDMGFLPDVRRILDHIPAKRQTLFFSATMPNEIRSLAVKILKDPVLVQIGTIAPANTVSHALYPVPDKLKKNLLFALLEQTPTGRALVFTRTKHRARTLALDLAKGSFRVAALQGNMSQNARQQAMDGFRSGRFDIMVATDIAAHGIDVPEISHVINFDFPNTADTYLHRIGRTGRAEQTGEAFTLAGAEDGAMIREVEKELGARIERRRLPGFDYGDFTPEEQFREERLGLRRAPGPGNGGRSRPANRPNNSQDRPRGNGASNNGRRSGQPAGRAAGANSSHGRRSEQLLGKTSRSDSSDGRRPGQILGRSSTPNSSNGRGRSPKQDAPSFHPRPARPGKPRGRSAARR
ncbi:MAG: DEAD/DEAH box helicase [Chloroflexi bacterium]|nr:DEAD/DEAH box helicase [Chloroflexota bacterium]